MGGFLEAAQTYRCLMQNCSQSDDGVCGRNLLIMRRLPMLLRPIVHGFIFTCIYLGQVLVFVKLLGGGGVLSTSIGIDPLATACPE